MHQDRAFDDRRHMSDRAVNERETYLDGMRGYVSLVVLLGHIIIALLPSSRTMCIQASTWLSDSHRSDSHGLAMRRFAYFSR
jgi:hypothetical protein